MKYDHTQRAPVWIVLVAIALLELGMALFLKQLPMRFLLMGTAVLFFFLAAMFAQLRIRDENGGLLIAFGPLELASKHIPYEDILTVQPARSRIIDGWGIHWVPGRGCTWNLWGRECVELETRRGILRLGTNDVEGLERHLRSRIGG